jgi:hypothetical protein
MFRLWNGSNQLRARSEMKDIPFGRAQAHMTCQSDRVVLVGKVQFSRTQILLRHHDLPRAPGPCGLRLSIHIHARFFTYHYPLHQHMQRGCSGYACKVHLTPCMSAQMTSAHLPSGCTKMCYTSKNRLEDSGLDSVWR